MRQPENDRNEPIGLDGLPIDRLASWLESMILIREFEEAFGPLAARAKIPYGGHQSAGQEAVAVGSIAALRPDDIITTHHRSHGHTLAKGVEPDLVMAELFGRSGGLNGGRCGTMHLADFARGHFGGNGIVGASVGIAAGAALAAQADGRDQVAVAYLGDGASNAGRVWESLNLAAAWRLPLIVIVENNLYAVETATQQVSSGTLVGRAEGFGVPALQLDGQDVGVMYRATRQARERAAAGDGPSFFEALTYRYEGHMSDQQIAYRTDDEVEEWRATRDPILRLWHAMSAAGLLPSDTTLESLVEHAASQVEEAVRFADESPWPSPETGPSTVLSAAIESRGA